MNVKLQLKQLQHQSGHKSSQGELNIALYHEKCVQDGLTKLIGTKKDACKAWLSWARLEESVVASELFKRVVELEQFHIEAYQKFFTEYEQYRSYFKEILKGEKLVEDARKTYEDSYGKVKSLQKKIDGLSAKQSDKKLEHYSTEMGRLLSEQRQKESCWKERYENHEQFKLRSIKEAIQSSTDAYIKLHERCYEIFQTQRLVLDFYTAASYSKLTSQVLTDARKNGDALITDLQRKLGFSELSVLEKVQSSAADELADFFGSPAISVGADDDSTYNPIPEYNDEPMTRDDEVVYEGDYMTPSPTSSVRSDSGSQNRRPLPPVPQTNAADSQPTYMNEEVYSDPNEFTLPSPTSPPPSAPPIYPALPTDRGPSSSVTSPTSPNAPPVPPRRDGSTRASLPTGGAGRGQNPYLVMESGPGHVGLKAAGSLKSDSPYMLMNAPPPPARQGSTKSTGSSGSDGRLDSGLGGSFKSRGNPSQEDVSSTCEGMTKEEVIEYEMKLWESYSNTK